MPQTVQHTQFDRNSRFQMEITKRSAKSEFFIQKNVRE